MHNVLKNIRQLSNESADRLMQALQVTVADLLWSTSGDDGVEVRAVPVLRHRLGPGAEAALTVHRGITPLPTHLIAGLVDPVAAVLGPDLALPRLVAVNDMVLLDQNPLVRSRAWGAGIWIVLEDGSLRVRYLRVEGSVLFTRGEPTPDAPREWKPVVPGERSVLEIVMARVAWVSRELLEEPAAA
jgi:hypothetical protein